MVSPIPREPTSEEYQKLRQLRVCPAEGRVYQADRECGSVDPTTGYHRISCGHGVLFKRSHVVWWAAKGEWPKFPLDHDNRIKTDDRISNLAPTTPRLNAHNSDRMRSRKLPINVAYNRGSKIKPYKVGLYVLGVYRYLGSFASVEEADTVAAQARADLETLTIEEWIKRYVN